MPTKLFGGTENARASTMLYSLIVGLIGGWLAGLAMKGSGYGILVDMLLGIVGSIIGSRLFVALGIWPGGGIVGAIIVSFVGAVSFVALVRLLRRA